MMPVGLFIDQKSGMPALIKSGVMISVLIALLMSLASFAAHADAVASLKQFFVTTTSLQGKFIQRVYQIKGPLLKTSSGEFELEHSGRFRWAYLKPRQQILVSNGKTLWIYNRDLAQVILQPLSRRLGRAPIMLLGSSGLLDQAYNLRDAGRRDGLAWVALTPRSPQNSQFQQVLIGLANNQISTMILFDQFGHRTVIQFTDLRRNMALSAKTFIFIPPPGVNVVGAP